MQDHSELCAPIANVVVRDHFVAEESRDAAQRITNDGRADVADVHGFGDIRGGEIHDDTFAISRTWCAEAWIGGERHDVRCVGFWEDAEIDKSRARNGAGGDAIEIDRIEQLLRQCAWIRLLLLRKHHRGVALVIAETEIRCSGDIRGARLAKDFF